MEDTKRQKHGFLSLLKNIRFSLALYWEERKATLVACALAIILRIVQPYLGILLPKLVIDEIIAQVTPERFLWVVGGISLIMVAVNYAKSYSDAIVDDSTGTIGISKIFVKQQEKRMNMDYALMEDPDVKTYEDKAKKAVQSNHSLAMNIPRTLVQLISNTLGFVLYAGIISTVHPAILLLLLISSAVNWWALSRARKYTEETREERSKLDRKLDALFETMRNSASAKDIRLYSAFDWLHGLSESLVNERVQAEGRVHTKQMQAQLVDALLILIRDGAAYAFLISMLLRGQLSLGDFVLVFAAVGALAGWISGILVAASDLSKANIEMGDVRAFLEYPDRMNTGSGIPLPRESGLPPSVELKNVSYTYPKSEKPTLKDINLSIRPGERIAVVGANGAGKTTLVKLICGLYLPTEGEVSLNGQSVLAYNRDEYYSLFSTVFQDIHLLSSDIAGNISQRTPEQTDYEKISRCLELTGLKPKVDALPNGEKTLLVRAVNADAIELSGGEKQKLAMARALYKNAPVIILDEPTAALDPIAENEVYQKYAELTEGKTSVYISHRLASTRFCDRILLIDGNTLTEQGTHDELMRIGGVYAHMFEVQSGYYQDSVKSGDREEEKVYA